MSETIQENVQNLRAFYQSGATQSYEFRLSMLKKLRESLRAHEKEAYAAFLTDYNKNYFETWAYEFSICYGELDEAIKNLSRWMGVKKGRAPVFDMPGRVERYRDPFGVVLIVSPWNFPFNLTFPPLIGAICGGNCAVVKPSNYCPTISAVIEKICRDAFPENYIKVVLGGREQNAQLFDQYFNFAFFTGGTKVARVLAEKCARHMTPYILELGGKSPVYIDKNVDMQECVDSLTWGKFANAGQICICPDYVLVHEDVHDEFVAALLKSIRKHQYSADGRLRSNFTAIISDRHFNRIVGLINPEKVIFGGASYPEKRWIEPTVMDGVTLDDACMQEEIFGPLVPIVTVKSKEEAVEITEKVGHLYNGSDGAQPLALYIYSKDKKVADYMLAHIQSGGSTVNGTIFHFIGLRFNGVGFSGSGDGYHGIASYLAFTHGRTVLRYDRLTPVHKLFLSAVWQRPITDKIVRAADHLVPLNRLCQFLVSGVSDDRTSKG